VELIGRVERPVSWVEFSVWKWERDDIRIGTYLYIFGYWTECKYHVDEVDIVVLYSLRVSSFCNYVHNWSPRYWVGIVLNTTIWDDLEGLYFFYLTIGLHDYDTKHQLNAIHYCWLRLYIVAVTSNECMASYINPVIDWLIDWLEFKPIARVHIGSVFIFDVCFIPCCLSCLTTFLCTNSLYVLM